MEIYERQITFLRKAPLAEESGPKSPRGDGDIGSRGTVGLRLCYLRTWQCDLWGCGAFAGVAQVAIGNHRDGFALRPGRGQFR